jgi:hypothetical protein
VVDAVIEGLNDITLGDGNLKVSRATVGVKQSAGLDGGVGAISMLASASAEENLEHGRVICLMNMVTSDELINDEEYEGKSALSLTLQLQLTPAQRSKRTSKRSARNTAPSSKQRSLVPPVLAPVLVSARSTSSTKIPNPRKGLLRPLLDANFHGEQSLRRNSLRRVLMWMRGRCEVICFYQCAFPEVMKRCAGFVQQFDH